MTLFTLMATLGLDTSEFERQSKGAVSQGKKLGGEIQKTITAATVAAGNLLAKATEIAVKFAMSVPKAAVQAAAEVEAENAQFAASFGEIASEAKKAYDRIGKETNILSARLQSTGTKGYSQLKGAGVEANEALDASARLLTLAADAAAYYDMSLEDADERLRSFLRGNTEAGDAIGLFTSESQRNTQAVEMYGKKWQDLTEAQKQMLMLNVAESIYEQSGAMGQAAREGSEWANVIANWQESIRQALASFGGPLKDSLIPAVESFTSFLSSNENVVANFGSAVGNLAKKLVDGLIKGLEWFSQNGDSLGEVISVVAGAFLALNLVLNPAKTITTLLIGAFASLVLKWDDVTAKAAEVGEQLQNWIIDKFNAAKDAIENAWEAIKDFISTAIPDSLKTAIQSIADAWSSVAGAIQSAIDNLTKWLGMDQGTGVHFAGETEFGGGSGPGFSSGLSYVPHDNFLARLHKGEEVLTAQEASVRRRDGDFSRNAQPVQPIVNNIYLDTVAQTADEVFSQFEYGMQLARFRL